MAIDTRAKRGATLDTWSPWFPATPVPDGSLADEIDRALILWDYPIGAEEAEEEPGEEPGDETDEPSAGAASVTPLRRLLVFSLSNLRWSMYAMAPLSLYVEEDRDLLSAGFEDGFIRDLEITDADDEDVTFDVHTKDFTGGQPKIRKLFQWVRLSIDTGGEAVTVELYVDDELVRSTTITDAARVRALLPFPAGCLGYRWSVRLVYEGQVRVKWYGVACVFMAMRGA